MVMVLVLTVRRQLLHKLHQHS